MAELKFKHISIGKDGSIWAVGKADGTIFRLYGDAGFVGWAPDKIGKAEVLAAVDWGNAWCINKNHEIWHLTNAESLDKGGMWTQVPTHSGRADARTISVGRDGSVWYAQLDGPIFRLFGDAGHVGWTPDKMGKAEVIAAENKGAIWCINKDHELWYLMNAENLDKGGKWMQVPTHSGRPDARTISVGNDGTVWLGDMDGAVFRHVQPGDGVGLPRWGTSWDRQEMGKVDILAAAQDLVWCLNTKGEVWRVFDGKWQQLVEIDPEGNMWTYKIKPGDGLMAIVRKEFHLKDPQDTQGINRLVDLIVAQNPGITRDKIKAGEVLKLRY